CCSASGPRCKTVLLRRDGRCASTPLSETTGTATTAAASPSAQLTWVSWCAACSADDPEAPRAQQGETMTNIDLFGPYTPEPFADFSDALVNASFHAALERVRGQLGREHPLIIGGEKVSTDTWLDSTDPGAPDRIVGRAAMAKAQHIDQAFDA